MKTTNFRAIEITWTITLSKKDIDLPNNYEKASFYIPSIPFSYLFTKHNQLRTRQLYSN